MVSAAPVWFSMLVQFVVAMVATISFGITFQVGRRHYWTCGFVGAVGWTIYIACTTLGGMTAPMATLIATLPLAALSRFFAIRHKAPITVFLLTGIFPLVPGAGIYYTAYYFLRNDRALCTSKGIETLKVAVALALGIAIVCSIPLPKRHAASRQKAAKRKNNPPPSIGFLGLSSRIRSGLLGSYHPVFCRPTPLGLPQS